MFVVILMHDSFANSFYNTYAWRKCKSAYKQKVGGLCERCLKRGLIKPGTQVHHKIRITPENMTDPAVTLSFDNLELLCDRCHEEEHGHQSKWRTDKAGRVEL